MLSNPTLDPDTPTLTSPTPSSEYPAPALNPGAELQASAGPSAGEQATPPGAAALVPPAKADLPPSGLNAQIERLKSEVPDIGVLGVTQELSDAEYVQLLACEEVVSMATLSWFEAGSALTQIRDEELWRGQYGSFEDYCATRWQFGRSKVHYLIGGASVCDSLRTAPGLPEPEFESQVRSLIRLEPQERIEAWQRAAGGAGNRRITAAMVQKAAKAVHTPGGQDSKQAEKRREQLERRRQVRELMSQLLELILARRPYEELIQKAAALDSQVRFFFPPPRKR